MTESMIEKVARAIAKADARPYEDAPNLFRGKARAAIEAMREPTDAMVDAGQWQIDPVSLYQSFINAALNEQVSG